MRRYLVDASLIGVVAVILFFLMGQCAAKREGVLEGELHAEQAKTKTLAKQYDSARVAVRVQADTVVRRVTRYQLARDTLRVTDTVQVRAFVRTADSTIKACTDYVSSCTLALARADTLRLSLVKQNEILRRSIPGKTSKVLTALKWGAVGYLAGRFTK